MTTTTSIETEREIAARPRPIIRAVELGTVSVLKAGALVLLSDAFGDVAPDRRGLGLYLGDTRVLSTALLRIEKNRPALLRPDVGGAASGMVELTNPELPDDPLRSLDHPIALPRQSIGIRRERTLDPAGILRERAVLTNYTTAPQGVEAELILDVDAADIFEVRGRQRARRGTLLPIVAGELTVLFRYRALDRLELRTEVTFDDRPGVLGAADDADPGPVSACWTLQIAPGGEAAVGWTVRSAWLAAGGASAAGAGSEAGEAPAGPPPGAPTGFSGRPAPATGVASPRESPSAPRTTAPGVSPGPARHDAASDAPTTIETDDNLVNLVFERATADLRLLQGPGPGPGERIVAAGIPWFSTLFGRDSAIAAYAALPFMPDLAVDALRVLADLQASVDDPATDAEPGKILHELRTGEMARLGELPFGRYYGSVDSTPLWLLLLGETMAWSADTSLLDELWPNAMRALAWLRAAPQDADGFLTYATRAPRGLRNQGWKDSADAVRDRRGGILEPPIALAEVQAYAAEARRRLGALARLRGDDELAAGLDREAAALADRFDRRFWRADLGWYAMALGPNRTPADALASNMGHCLWAGAVPAARAAAVVRALTGPELFSGWGIRTYGARQPGFNPLGYHTGSVWPHDTAIAAAGLKRYGFHEDATALAWAVLDAARHSSGFRLPEHFCGFDRTVTGAPVPHPVACAPQAWAAAAPFLLLTTMLGLVPRAPTRELQIVRPVLPAELSKVVIRGLRLGDARLDLLFHRWRGATSAEVLSRTGDVRVTVHL